MTCKVRNMISDKGNDIANQFIISDNLSGITIFQSYQSTIAVVDKGNKLTLGKRWNYSRTTVKYLYQFLKYNGFNHLDSKKVILEAITDSEIKYDCELI